MDKRKNEVYKEVLDLIQEAAETHASALDLRIPEANLLSALPAELGRLTTLTSLNLSGLTSLTDLQPLANLTALQSLDVSRCEQIPDLQPVANLTALQSLEVSGCQSLRDSATLLPLLPTLERLYLYGCPWADLPTELCGNHAYDNVLDKVRAHYQDLESGAVSNAEIKVLFLGNGGVGKSQLSRRMRNLPYDPDLPTTHGIQLSQKTLELDGVDTAITLNLWDFGGQEIYHGSHALFLQGQSVFLLLWTPQKEETNPYQEQGLVMRNRPLAYWLDYLRWFAGASNPLLVIQSQCDKPAQRIPNPPGVNLPGEFTALHTVYVSAQNGLGLGLVSESLKEAVRHSLELRPPPPIGVVRARVRERLRAMLTADQDRPAQDRQHQWLEREYFNQLCDEEGGISDTEALLDFLHHSGVIFYRRGLFSGRIILDQNWALAAIYALFDRQKVLPQLRGYGRFSRADLEVLAWSSYTREEQLVFLDMMIGCGICFKTRQLPNQDTNHEEWEYIAPELLPSRSAAYDDLLIGRLLTEPATEEVEAHYGFLHEGVLRNFLSKIGQQAGGAAIYWKYGCWFYEKTTACRVLIDSRWEDGETETGPGSIRFQAWGQHAREVLQPLVKELQSLPVGRPPEVAGKHGKETGTPLTAPKAHLAAAEEKSLKDLNIATEIQAPAGQPTVYISYAWGDKSSPEALRRGQIVEDLCAAIDIDGWKVIRDRTAMQNGDFITDFMKTITRADRIIIVVSKKYLHSEFCMTELHGIYTRSRTEKEDFLDRIVPLSLEDANFSHWRDRRDLSKHWRIEFEEMEESVHDLGASDLCLYKAMRDWHNDVGDILAYLSDVLHPHGFDSISANNFAALKQMLRREPKTESQPNRSINTTA